MTTSTCPTSSSREVSAPLDPARRAELVAALAALRTRLAEACAAAARDPRELVLVAVTKGFPASDVAILTTIGVSQIGENRDQEARPKVAALRRYGLEWGVPEPRWHFVGRLQTNKCRSVARYAGAVHSVDRPALAAALGAAAANAGRQLAAFLQVSLDGDPTRGGALVEAVPALADAIAAQPSLTLTGVMAVAPLGADPDAAFARLREVAATLQADHPAATAISAGMSADLEAAIRHGATHLRVGSALLGPRNHYVG